MISTRPTKPEQLDLEPWSAHLILNQKENAGAIADYLFTKPEYLRARLNMGGIPARIAARHIQAACECLMETRFEPARTGKLSSG